MTADNNKMQNARSAKSPDFEIKFKDETRIIKI